MPDIINLRKEGFVLVQSLRAVHLIREGMGQEYAEAGHTVSTIRKLKGTGTLIFIQSRSLLCLTRDTQLTEWCHPYAA